jgi:hypothetical protein
VEKVCTVLWAGGDAAAGVHDWVRDAVVPHLLDSPLVRAATVHTASADPAYDAFRHGAGVDGLRPAGLLSLWLDSYQDDAGMDDLVRAGPVPRASSYLVCESVPQPYGDVMTWPEGSPSPGLSIVTLLDKPPETDEKVFYHYWHELHRRTTAECHPFSSYVRNEVARPLTDGAQPCRGIVTESSPDVQDFLDPHRFYVSGGSKDQLRVNQRRVVEETSHFIDFASIQVAPMTEYVVRRLAPTSP